jgi:hypothetical protein
MVAVVWLQLLLCFLLNSSDNESSAVLSGDLASRFLFKVFVALCTCDEHSEALWLIDFGSDILTLFFFSFAVAATAVVVMVVSFDSFGLLVCLSIFGFALVLIVELLLLLSFSTRGW